MSTGQSTAHSSLTAFLQLTLCKARCDLKVQFPSRCTRCEKSQRSCQTDASFQRVPARRRIKELEAQVEQLHRSRVLEAPSKRSERRRSSEFSSPSSQQGEKATLSQHALESPDREYQVHWYVPSEVKKPSTFILHDCTLSYEDVNELFVYFVKFYLPQCSFLIPIGSLAELAEESELLLWTIVLIAARHHHKHHQWNQELEIAHSRLRASTSSETIAKLPDLQAVLLLCMWPLPVNSKGGDTSATCIGQAISCARQMGLDTRKDEVLFGTRRAADRVLKYPSRVVRLTWLKCFELDVQWSLWHGVLPALAASRYFRSVADCCRSTDILQTESQDMDIYVLTARYLSMFDDTFSSEAAWNLAKSFQQSLSLARENKLATWSFENELTSETSQMYICMAAFIQVTQLEPSAGTDVSVASQSVYAKELLLDAKERACQVTRRLSALSEQTLRGDQSLHHDSTPLLGYPKHTARVMFYAASVLLKYLDTESDQSPLAQEKARNAFREALHFFQRCPKARPHQRAGHTLELVGRAIAQGRARLESHVTSRMGASIMHDVNWLADHLREAGLEDVARADSSRDSGKEDIILAAPPGAANVAENSEVVDHWEQWCYPGTEALPFSMDHAAFEAWDDTLDGIWQNEIVNQDMTLWDDLLA